MGFLELWDIMPLFDYIACQKERLKRYYKPLLLLTSCLKTNFEPYWWLLCGSTIYDKSISKKNAIVTESKVTVLINHWGQTTNQV